MTWTYTNLYVKSEQGLWNIQVSIDNNDCVLPLHNSTNITTLASKKQIQLFNYFDEK